MNIKDIHWDWLVRSFIATISMVVVAAIVMVCLSLVVAMFSKDVWYATGGVAAFIWLWRVFYNDLP